MKRLWLIIFCIGAICSIELAGSVVFYRMVYAQDPAFPVRVETASIRIEAIDTLYERRINITVSSRLTDEVVFILRTLPNVQAVTIQGVFVNDVVNDIDIMQLTWLPDLREIHLRCGSKITDAGMQALTSFKKLESLTIAGNFSEAGFASLGKLGQLRELNLTLNTPVITGQELAVLEKLPELRKLTLDISNTEAKPDQRMLSDTVFSQLQNLNNLEELTINCDGFTGSGLSHLSKLKSLRKLTLRSRSYILPVPRFSHLADLPQLTDLAIHGPLVDDTTIESLKTLQQLKSLDLRWTKVSASEVGRLERALSGCAIKR